jgi:hypothetical protein
METNKRKAGARMYEYCNKPLRILQAQQKSYYTGIIEKYETN